MSALPPGNESWPVFSAVAQWWRRWTGAGPRPFEPEPSGPDEIKRWAPEPVLSTSELLTFSSQGLSGSGLLERRMAALNLDPDELAGSEHALLRDLQRLCATCPSPVRCARDIAQELARDPIEPASSDWREYCPNSTTLYLLSTLKSYSEVAAQGSPSTES